MRLCSWALVGIVVACSGCAANRPSVADVAQAQAAIEDAETVGANDDLNAALYLSLAHEEIGRARARVAQGDLHGAARWAQRAQMDAGVAALLAREVATRAAVGRTFEHARSLTEELESRGQ